MTTESNPRDTEPTLDPDQGVDDAMETAAPQASRTLEERGDRGLLRLETRLAKAEAQIRTMQDGIADLNRAIHLGKQRALILRIAILIALLGAFFYMQSL